MSLTDSFVALAWLAILLLALAMFGLNRQFAQLITLQSRRGTTPLPEANLELPDSLLSLANSGPTLLLFVSSSCIACHERLAYLSKREVIGLGVVLVTERGDPLPSAPPALARFETTHDHNRLGIRVTPYGVLLDMEGRIQIAQPIGNNEVLEGMLTTLENQLRSRTRAEGG